MILQADIDMAHQLRAWSDAGTLLDLFTQTEALQVRILSLDIIERAGAQYILFECELVEASPNPLGPQPQPVGGGGLIVVQGLPAMLQPTPIISRGQVSATQGAPSMVLSQGPGSGAFVNPEGMGVNPASMAPSSGGAGTGGFVQPTPPANPVSPVMTPVATLTDDVVSVFIALTGSTIAPASTPTITIT